MEEENRDQLFNEEVLSFEDIYKFGKENPLGLSFALHIIHDVPQEVACIIADVVKLSDGDQEWFYSALDCCAISISTCA